MPTKDTKLGVVIAGVLLLVFFTFLVNTITGHHAFVDWANRQPWYFLPFLVSVCALVILGMVAMSYIEKRPAKEVVGQPTSAPISSELRRRLLDRVKSQRVDARIQQGLRQALRLDLALTEMPDAVAPKLRMYSNLEAGPMSETEINDPIDEVFGKAANRRLLILGEPGTGKTNCIIELCSSLIRNARTHKEFPIPVIFSFPNWPVGDKIRPIEDWLVEDLRNEYGLSLQTAQLLVTSGQILPLLDGLDELAPGHRAACVSAINTFIRSRDLASLAICCRLEQYSQLPKLDLDTAIQIEKLTRDQVKTVIGKPQMGAVRRALNEDPALWEIIDTPLWLHVLFGAAQVARPKRDPSVDPRDRLYARFVQYALHRISGIPSRTHTKKERFLYLLGWIATSMQDNHQSEFTLDELADKWLDVEGRKMGLLNSLFSRLLRGLFHGAALMLIAVGVYLPTFLIVGFHDPQWRSELSVFAVMSIFWGLIGMGTGLLCDFASVGRPDALLGLFDKFAPAPIKKSSRPDFILIRSALIGLGVTGIGTCLVFAIIPALEFGLTPLWKGLCMIAISWPLFAYMAGVAYCAQHYSNRLCLWFVHGLPVHTVRFLDESADTLFLARHGSTFEFFHITFRDYMAKTYGTRNTWRAATMALQHA